MRKRAAVFIINEDKILLFRRRKNGLEYYAVPGGGVEPKESLEEAAMREIREETSLEISLDKLVGILDINDSREYFFIAKNFKGSPQLSGPELKINSPENQYELEWINLEEIPKIDLREEIKKLLQEETRINE